MLNRYDQLWRLRQQAGPIRPAIGMSALLHGSLLIAAILLGFIRDDPITQAEVFAIEFSPETLPEPEPPAPEPIPKPPEPEPEPEPIPEPPEPEPEPEPEPIPEPEPEPAREPPKPEPKPEPPKEKPKPKPKPKPEPPKEKPKPEPPKEEPTPEPKPVTPPAKPEVRMKQALPGPLAAWGRLVQKKVEKGWRLPGGILIDPNENEAVVSFWVGKNGQLIGEPEIVKHAADAKVASTAIESIKASAPFPPLPDHYHETEAHVIYTFVPAG